MPASISTERRMVAESQRRMLEASRVPVRTRDVTLASGITLQVLEAGEGDPLVFWHGSGVNALSMLPLLEHIRGRRVIAPHRPGYGLSGPVSYTRTDIRRVSVRIVDEFLDAEGVERADMVGNSTGGVWALWTALDRPTRVRRIVLAGATPLLPGTAPPVPLRLMSTPLVGSLLARVMPEPSPETVRKMMAGMGEGETIDRHPALIEAFVAAGSDEVAGSVAHAELSAMIRGVLGFRPEHRFTPSDLARVTHPVLLAWGAEDPVGDVDVARHVAPMLPSATVEAFSGGHAPWLGEAERMAEVVRGFLAG